MQHRLACSEVWGGVRDQDVDACSATVDASLLSMACEGGRGGDLYCLSVCDGDLLTRVVLADVVGHGPTVSEASELLFEATRRQMNCLQGERILAELNELALERGRLCMTTAAVAGFYRSDSKLYFSYAGHHPALVLRRGHSHWRPVRMRNRSNLANLPLGVLPDTSYEHGELPLRSGDRLAMYTDGLIEAPRAGDGNVELFGLDRLQSVLDTHAHDPLPQLKAAVIAAVRQHTGGSLAHDDVTLLIAEMR
jgi:sigma-B regulation protein RsbU (phosphoserine phosphatase)